MKEGTPFLRVERRGADGDHVRVRGWPTPGKKDRTADSAPAARLVLPDAGAVERDRAVDVDPSVPGLAAMLAHRADNCDSPSGEADLNGPTANRKALVIGNPDGVMPVRGVSGHAGRVELGGCDHQCESAVRLPR